MACKALRWEVENSTGSAACAISKAAPLQTSLATCLQQHPPGWADGAAFCPQRAAGRAGPWPRCEGLGQRRELAEGRAACAPRGAERRGDGCSLLQLMPLLRLGREAEKCPRNSCQMRGAHGPTQSPSSGMLLRFVPQPGFLIKLKHFGAGAAWDTGRAWLPATRPNLALPKNASSGAGQTFHTLGQEEGKYRQGFFFFFFRRL